MQKLQSSLSGLLQSLPPRPISKSVLDRLVEGTVSQGTGSPENRKSQWEYVLRNDILDLAATEGTALKDYPDKYYDDMKNKLDLALTFTELGACESVFPFNILSDLLEAQTIASCSHIFSWIEERADRLTEGMVPQKGKALVALRTLNDLLRRLSKMGSTTQFCGRILTFLSQVFPLGERSGVNLRGEYGPAWDGPGVAKEGEDAKMVEDRPEGKVAQQRGDAMQVDEPKQPHEKEESDDFFNTFWSLQLPFSKPTVFAEPGAFEAFKDSVNRVFPVIKEATAKERALMGSKTLSSHSGAGLKRKREPEIITESASRDYFFAKYLTSPELLDLEVADTHFRRQFLFQLLILLNHLLLFTKADKSTWATPRNRSLQMDFTLEPTDAQWVQDMVVKTQEELRQTAPNGRAFADTVHTILEREKNWIKWKNDMCAPFDKLPWSQEFEGEENGQYVKRNIGLEETTQEMRKKMSEPPKEWEHPYGTGPLTEIWMMGYRDLSDLQHPFQPGDIKDFVKKIKQVDARIDSRRNQLLKAAERVAQARAKAAAAAATTPAVAPVTLDAITTLQEESSSTVAAATTSISTPPLHPSLPAKPGTIVSPPSSQETKPPVIVAPTPVPAAAPPPPPAVIVELVLPPDEILNRYEEDKQRWAWLALRTGRDQYLSYLGKIGTGDVLLLAQEIEEQAERERIAREEAAKAEEHGSNMPTGHQDTERAGENKPEASESMADTSAGTPDPESHPKNPSGTVRDPEGDMKMET